MRSALRIYFRNRCFISRVDFDHIGVLVNNLRLVIAHLVDLMGNLLEAASPNDNAHQFFATQSDLLTWITDPGHSNRFRRPPLIRKRIKRQIDICNLSGFRFQLSGFDERFRHRNLMDAVLRQRNPNGVPNSIGQQRSDTDRALNPRILTFTGFGHAKMNRIIPIRAFFIQSRDE